MGRLIGPMPAAVLLLCGAAVGCAGRAESTPQLVDGSTPGAVPTALATLDDAVLTRTSVTRARDVARDRLAACGVAPEAGDTAVVERVGLRGSSLTFAGRGSSLSGCNAIPDPVPDPDRPFEGIWCGASVGRLENGTLIDPRLNLCTSTDGALTAFVWVEPRPVTEWVVVADAGQREVYEVARSLPVRVTTTDRVRAEGSASFDIEEYAADGTRIRTYTLEASVAG